MQTRADDGSIVEGGRGLVERGAREAVGDAASTMAPEDAEHLPERVIQLASVPTSDRWHWRRRIRANPHQHFAYRIVIALLGLLCIGAGIVTGPLPGPGGIPLVLLGLAVWASEFAWAHRLMMWCKERLHQVRQLTPRRKVLFWAVFVSCCGLLGYSGMLIFGLPGWLPTIVHDVLGRLPGVRVRG